MTTSAPVAKFDFGKAPAAPAMRPEPMQTAIPAAAATPIPQTAAPRVPSDLKPVSENRSFGEAPTVRAADPQPPVAANGTDFRFDFGLDKPVAANDPIADLIEAESQSAPEADLPPRQAAAAPVVRTQMSPAPTQAKPSLAPVSAAPERPANQPPIPLKPVSVTPRPAESDRFAISPGMGLNANPAASQPLNPRPRAPEPEIEDLDDTDPMSEIESLIGEAVRFEHSSPGPVKVQAQVTPSEFDAMTMSRRRRRPPCRRRSCRR